MTKLKYINLVMGKEVSDVEKFALWKILEDGGDKDIQHAINTVAGTVLVREDGFFGPGTLKALLKVGVSPVLSVMLYKETFNAPSATGNINSNKHSDSKKEGIMNYLARWEGTTLHWNRRETDMTTPYGIYRKSFPKAKIFKYIDKLSKKYLGKTIRKRNLVDLNKFNKSITNSEKDKIRDMAYDFYMDTFMNDKVNGYLNPKEALTFFSLSVNGGLGRGAKALQSALGTVVDGKIGKGTLKALKTAKTAGRDLNNGMLTYMENFYRYLVRKNPKKYRVNLKGWLNRLNGLR
jgi:lysozyme family protein